MHQMRNAKYGEYTQTVPRTMYCGVDERDCDYDDVRSFVRLVVRHCSSWMRRGCVVDASMLW